MALAKCLFKTSSLRWHRPSSLQHLALSLYPSPPPHPRPPTPPTIHLSPSSPSGDATPCKVTPVILHGVVSPAGCIPRHPPPRAPQRHTISVSLQQLSLPHSQETPTTLPQHFDDTPSPSRYLPSSPRESGGVEREPSRERGGWKGRSPVRPAGPGGPCVPAGPAGGSGPTLPSGPCPPV